MAAERGYRDIMEDKERPPREHLNIDKRITDGTYTFSVNQKEAN